MTELFYTNRLALPCHSLFVCQLYSVKFGRQFGFWLQTFHDKQFGDDQHLPFSGLFLSLVVM